MGRWMTTTTYTETATHQISYYFTCPICGKTTPEMPLSYEISYQPSVTLAGYNKQAQFSPQDAAAIAQTAKNRLRTRLINDYISTKRAEFSFVKAQCPMCAASWEWKPSKKLFSKRAPEPVAEEYRPAIDWRFDRFYPGFADEVEQLQAKLPGLFTSEGFLRVYYEDSNNAGECFKFVVPGVRAVFLNDLMGSNHPLEAFPYQAVRPKDAPPLDSGELGYGYFDGNKTRWAIVKNGFVVRKT